MINEAIVLRQELHKNPEVSNNEFKTSDRIVKYMSRFNPDEIISLSNTGKAVVFKGIIPGKTIIFRAELDALSITEESTRTYTSANNGVSHACGHDGHMAILAELASRIAENRPTAGRVVLLFQPAEELEQGAKDVLKDKAFMSIEPDYIFALHNIPGIDKHKVVIKRGSFTAASKGMTVKLIGKTSHAAEPENGINPANAIAAIIERLNAILANKQLFSDLTLLTIIHMQLGEISFGTSPGYAEIRITLRAFENADMSLLTKLCEKAIVDVAGEEKLSYEISYTEVFPASINSGECVTLVEDAAVELSIKTETVEKPFKWSEDFGYYTQKYSGCLFGLGAGKSTPALHNPDYDFPDDIIETGAALFYSIYKKLNF